MVAHGRAAPELRRESINSREIKAINGEGKREMLQEETGSGLDLDLND
jgi:hypothetical protein